jgi:hypothetical protein
MLSSITFFVISCIDWKRNFRIIFQVRRTGLGLRMSLLLGLGTNNDVPFPTNVATCPHRNISFDATTSLLPKHARLQTFTPPISVQSSMYLENLDT